MGTKEEGSLKYRPRREGRQITTTLRNYVQTLTYHQATGVLKLESKLKTSAVWLVPFDRNSDFVGREEIIERLESYFAVRNGTQSRVALTS